MDNTKKKRILFCLVASTFMGCAIVNRTDVFHTILMTASNVTHLSIVTARSNVITLNGVSSWTAEKGWSRDTVAVIDTSSLNRNGGFKLINGLAVAGRLDFRRVASYRVADEWLTPMDKEILEDGPVKDLATVASRETSLLEAHPVPRGGVVRVGDNVTVRVILKDTRGTPVLTGGHEVLVWMVGKGPRGRAAAVDVTDLRNGTYVTSLPMLWSGKVEVRAALVRTREFRRVLLTLMDTMKMIQPTVAAFVSGKTEQVTLCSFIPVIPGFPEVCNLTSVNSGMPWYCGKPSKPGLQCRHWAWSSHTGLPRRYPLSDAENNLTATSVEIHHHLSLLKQRVSLTVDQVEGIAEPPIKPCIPLQPRDTWSDQSPRGYWEMKKWHPLRGCPLPHLNTTEVRRCLRDTHVVVMGDSNARKVVLRLKGLGGCRMRADPQRSHHPTMLHVPLLYDCSQHNIHLSWYPHAYPFYTGSGQWSDSRVKHAPSDILDKLPSSGHYVVAIHLFMHFSREHTAILALHVKDTARAVRDLLKRNPGVKVFIIGPHFIGMNAFCVTCDLVVERGLRMVHHEFRELRDHVFLLNTWDMTVALENCAVHPDLSVADTLARMILAYVCPYK